MDTDRPHRSNSSNNSSSSNSSTSELFICFTSRLSSSSSMKISSKSILSPGRARESSQISLSNSLSRRLRTNGSMKGGQASPMFPTSSGKKRGCTFENPEPSSPKVTCIGQVRVKTKKQSHKFKTRSQRRASSGGGEVSFRRVDQNSTNNNSFDANSNNRDLNNPECLPHRNQRWVNLPLTICEALREFNCFLPCRSSCMANDKGKEEKTAAAAGDGSSNGSSCAAVFARWLVAVQEGDGKGREIELVVGEEEEDGKGREIELVVGEEEEEEEDEEESMGRRRSYRRHIFEEIEFKEENASLQEEEARVSICIPPKNALLLMRCRSDPVKMAALANKFWEAPLLANDEEEEGEEDCGKSEKQEMHNDVREKKHKEEDLMSEKLVPCETIQENKTQESEVLEEQDVSETRREDTQEIEERKLVKHAEETEKQENMLEENEDLENSINNQENEEKLIQESKESQEDSLIDQEDYKQERDFSDGDIQSSLHMSVQPEEEVVGHDIEDQESKPEELIIQESKQEEEEEEEEETELTEETVTHERSESEDPKTQEGQMDIKSKERESQPMLPDCLLLMMCEPKLSMEVSKETWVCSTDFIRWLPEHSRPVKKKDGGDEPKRRVSIDINPPSMHGSKLQQPPRSSCSYPAKPPPRAAGAESMSTAIEKKLVGTKGYEPFVLTRCKSEPMRSASKLAPDACFWKNRKLEPHRPATLGISAAGVGC
ncbi:hypothetical protein JCGZ_15297 [Jatropha curcas]|uniref:Uncharacterized protein n=1 Tax=Jatropha curcas TaxID=180498 RepID=A0A067LF51_JATCU|nr:eukaryotic translation initiation factor 5B [Jatropha curcas]KDP45853.1 hypothetical protein JCGZ_15297 [Jatropha curcas]